MQTRSKPRGRRVPRKPTDGYAQLAVPPALLKSLLASTKHNGKPLSIRKLSEYCGHEAHQHLMRLVNGQINTTSVRTATIVEQFLGQPGLLFTRHPAKTIDQVHPVTTQNIPAPRRAA